MFDAVVVGLLGFGLVSGAIGVLSAWYENRKFRAGGLPPLIVFPQPATPVEPMVGAVIRPSPPTAPLNVRNVAEAPRPQSPPTLGERIVSDDSLSALESSYEIIRALGYGETSVVYLARERASNDEVAIKLIRSKYLGDEEAMGRCAREARFLERLVHPNIVRVRAVLELGRAGLAIVMAYVTGRTLEELIRNDGRLAPERAERFTRDIACALVAAHAMGIVHRNVKPENVFVDSDDRPLLTDFGLARTITGDSQLTMAGIATGPPSYMAPEPIDGGSLDARGDVYSLGLLAWEMLSGRRPYQQRYDKLADVRDLRDDVPGPFADAIAVAIEKDPKMRWQTIGQMIEGLDSSSPIQRTTRRPPLTADTERLTRPSPPEPHFDSSAAIESIAAELAAQNTEPVSKTRRRYLLAIGGVAAVMTLAAVVAKMQRHSGDMRVAPAPLRSSFDVSDSAGRSLPATQIVASPSTPDSRTTPRQERQIADSSAENPPPPRMPDARAHVALDKTLSRKDVAKAHTKTDSKTAGNDGSKKAITTAHTAADTPAPDKPTSAPALSVVSVAGPSPSRVTIAAGGLHSCMVDAEGRAYCWGSNVRGQLSADDANSEVTPFAVAGGIRFTAIATGLAHSCAIAHSGAVWCWGENEHGQLGDRSTLAHLSPARIAGARIFTAVGVGVAHSCALDSQSEALCWGSNARGQLGSDRLASDIAPPTLVAGDHHYSSIAVGWNFTCALDRGRAFCWGDNSNGQLGDGSITDRRVPVPVAGGFTFRSIAAGATHTCGVTLRGEAYCWGNNSGGQLGDGTRVSRAVPTAVKTWLRFVAIATGALHTCALTADGEAVCWGRDNFGQLGDGGNAQDSAEPVRVVGNHSFAAVRAFGSHTCATTSSGDGFCWGYNLDGQLGDGSRVNRTRPVYVEPPSGK
jgi:serine/threonine protein kinase/alpha-tubulin suppressor-like RCC1 family protein